MTTAMASSLSVETARLDRTATQRRSPDTPADRAGSGGFAGLLRAAGGQAGDVGSGGPAAAGDSAAGRRAAAVAEATRRPALNEPAVPQPGCGDAGATDGADRSERNRGAERARASSRDSSAAEQAEGASEEEGVTADTEDTEKAADPATAGGGATLAHWLTQMAAQRRLAAAGGRSGVPSTGLGEAGGPRGAAPDAASGASARMSARAAGVDVPGWTRPDAGNGAEAGRWAGGGSTFDAAAAMGDQTDAAAKLSLESNAPQAAGAGPDAAGSFAGQLAALVNQEPRGAGMAPAAVTGEAVVQTPVGTPGFGDEVMFKVAAFSQEGVQEAQLHLNPVELGPIQVRIAIEGTQARIDFGAAAVGTRELLEAALPALAQALQADGLQLASTSAVGDVAAAEPGHAGRPQAGPGDGQGNGQDRPGDRSGGWGQQAEAGGAGASRARLAAAGAGAGGMADQALGWAGLAGPAGASGLRGLDLYA